MVAKHDQPSPFPAKLSIGVVLDERCCCGHLRSEHVDTVAYGHGACADCECPKYTWKAFIFKTNVSPIRR